MTAELLFPPLSAVRLPEGSAELRAFPLPAARRTAAYEKSFDQHTLIYDAIRLDDRRVRLVCPRLLNLRKTLRKSLKLNSSAIHPRRHKKSLRFETIDVNCRTEDTLSISVAGQEARVEVHAPETLFDDMNVAFTIVKNTPPDWIVDWARFHVSAHGLEGVLLYDNGTSTYDMRETGARLAAETGLKAVAVVSAPFPYGGNAGGKFVAPAKYLQVSLMQIARWRFFPKARAVLSVDIDELVAPTESGTVFSKALDAKFGLLRLNGGWVYPAEGGSGLPQRAHLLSVPESKACQPKWCLARSGVAAKAEWSVHRPGGVLFPFAPVGGTFWHCRATTTGWKAKRNKTPAGAVVNKALQNALLRHLG